MLEKRWSNFIEKVYETDPLTCPKCQGRMGIISFIDRPEVINGLRLRPDLTAMTDTALGLPTRPQGCIQPARECLQ